MQTRQGDRRLRGRSRGRISEPSEELHGLELVLGALQRHRERDDRVNVRSRTRSRMSVQPTSVLARLSRQQPSGAPLPKQVDAVRLTWHPLPHPIKHLYE
jgi:hypothetical protein